eukprot:scaffold96649_cov33-Tisochrysis_lutea.AAC.3
MGLVLQLESSWTHTHERAHKGNTTAGALVVVAAVVFHPALLHDEGCSQCNVGTYATLAYAKRRAWSMFKWAVRNQ